MTDHSTETAILQALAAYAEGRDHIITNHFFAAHAGSFESTDETRRIVSRALRGLGFQRGFVRDDRPALAAMPAAAELEATVADLAAGRSDFPTEDLWHAMGCPAPAVEAIAAIEQALTSLGYVARRVRVQGGRMGNLWRKEG